MPFLLAPATKKYLLHYFENNNAVDFARLAIGCIQREQDPLWACPDELRDDFLDFYFQSIESFFSSRAGVVYCAAVLDKDRVYKVGLTSKDALTREKSLKTAGVFVGVHVVHERPVYDRHWTEALIHSRLLAFHVDREFFQIDYDTLFKIVEECVQLDSLRYHRAVNFGQ